MLKEIEIILMGLIDMTVSNEVKINYPLELLIAVDTTPSMCPIQLKKSAQMDLFAEFCIEKIKEELNNKKNYNFMEISFLVDVRLAINYILEEISLKELGEKIKKNMRKTRDFSFTVKNSLNDWKRFWNSYYEKWLKIIVLYWWRQYI